MFGKSSMRFLAFLIAVSAFAFPAAAQTAANSAPSAASPAASASSSPENASPGPVKIGIVNIQDAIIATNEGKKEFDSLQTKFAPKQSELKALNDEVEKMKSTFEAQKDKLSPDASATQVRAIEAKQKTLQRSYDDAQSEFQQAEQEVVNRIGGKMLDVMQKYAKAHGYSMILDVSNPQTPVLWASEGSNITKELVDAYNAESPVAPPAPGAKASTAPSAPRPATPTATPKKP